jgi:hypothetical protein
MDTGSALLQDVGKGVCEERVRQQHKEGNREGGQAQRYQIRCRRAELLLLGDHGAPLQQQYKNQPVQSQGVEYAPDPEE